VELLGVSEPVIRLSVFGLIFCALALLELWSPRLERPELLGALKAKRWLTNVSIVIVSSLALRIIFPLAAVGTAIWAESREYGILPWLGIPSIAVGVIAFIILDFAIWFEHLMSHKISLFWRVHRMHHADIGFDVTTALRFHPIEIVLSMLWKAVVIILLGAPPVAVLIFEIVLNGSSMFNHANLKLPEAVDRLLRLVIVTPDMHRIHHSTERAETDSNYGFNFTFWDRLFGTYRREPIRGRTGIEIGIEDWRDERPAHLVWSLLLPFKR
jgi:sterol desaturase/sphingolipid hydroxylase (fatty acid hydroxylase superfamily)